MNPISFTPSIYSNNIAFGINTPPEDERGNRPQNFDRRYDMGKLKVLPPKSPQRSRFAKLKLAAIALGVLQPALVYPNTHPHLKTSTPARVISLASTATAMGSFIAGCMTVANRIKRRNK